jgi:tetraacyldisaccharide 4'-kinase
MRTLSARLSCFPWGLLMAFRRWAYRKEYLPVYKPELPVLAVGNLALGGTGKSPLIRLLASNQGAELPGWAHESGQVAILLRGYGRKSRGFKLVSQMGNVLCGLEEAGDEALMLARQCPGALVAVCEDRVEGARRLRDLGAERVLLDDGYQHQRIGRDVNVLVWRADQNPAQTGCLPFAPFRESANAALDATCIVFSRCERGDPQAAARWFGKLFSNAGKAPVPMFRMLRDTISFHSPTGQIVDPPVNFGLFSAIGDPAQLEAMLAEAGHQPRFHQAWRDHHAITPANMEQLVQRCKCENCDTLLCTWKDLVKLPTHQGLPLVVVDQQLRLEKL